jgi:hypothetical protein
MSLITILLNAKADPNFAVYARERVCALGACGPLSCADFLHSEGKETAVMLAAKEGNQVQRS